MQHFDVTVVGAGMVGLSLVRALKDTPLRIGLVNKGPLVSPLSTQPELRVSAINEVNRNMFQVMGIWQRIPQERFCDYQHMHVWDQDSFGKIQFAAKELGVAQLGAIVENQALVNALAEVVQSQDNVTVFESVNIDKLSLGDAQHALVLDNGELLSSAVVIGADGTNSQVRKVADFPMNHGEYGQTAIVATIKTEKAHLHTARQVFTPYGPLALLPLADKYLCSIVWSQDSEQATSLMSLDDSEFDKALMVACNHVLGMANLASERRSFPLNKSYARQWVDDGLVLCGDAAHTFHPLAGQGANLGFEDAWLLAETLKAISDSGDRDFRSKSAYRAYERNRKTAAVKMLMTMESFHQLFTGHNDLKKGIRGLGLIAANAFAPAKNALAREALGI